MLLVVENSVDAVILHCVGRIVAGEADVLQNAVVDHVDKRVIILDLAGVEDVDAAGLGMLVFLQTLGCAVGFDLQLMNANHRLRELLELTGLESVLALFSDESEARSTNRGGSNDRRAAA